MADDRPTSARCLHCGRRFKISPTGRIPVYCSANCRQLAFMKNERIAAVEERHRTLTWELLQDAGLVPADKPLPPPRKPEHE